MPCGRRVLLGRRSAHPPVRNGRRRPRSKAQVQPRGVVGPRVQVAARSPYVGVTQGVPYQGQVGPAGVGVGGVGVPEPVRGRRRLQARLLDRRDALPGVPADTVAELERRLAGALPEPGRGRVSRRVRSRSSALRPISTA